MVKIISNEINKIFYRKTIYIFVTILLLITLFNLIGAIVTNNYMSVKDSGQTFPLTLFNAVASFIIPIFIIVLIGNMITDEYNDGSLKLSLLRPISRNQLLLGKLSSMLIVCMTLLMFLLVIGYALGIAVFGLGDGFFIKGRDLSLTQGILFTLLTYGLSLISYLSFGTLILFISMVIQNSGAVVAIGMSILLSSLVIGQVFVKLSPYLITSYFNTFSLLTSALEIKRIVLGFTIVIFYGVIMYALSSLIFNRKDILI